MLGAATCTAAIAEQKIALVIGNSAYPSAALRNPVNDAKAMAAKLSGLGFEVILRTDASQRDMTRAVSQFGQKLRGGSIGLFYFAGHGLQVRGKNFLIPVDAEIENEASTRSEAVDVDQVLEQLGSARLSMVILDACRNNPFERRFRSTGSGGLAQIDAPTGTLLAYATAPGKVAYDGTGANGLYTTELLKALDTPGLKVEDVFKQVRINVLKASDNQQIPWESSSLIGEFYFKPEIRPQLADINAQQAARERAELQKALEEERRRRDQDSKTQADLQRSIDEERRRRDQDAEILRKELDKLRAELVRFSETVPAGRPASAAPPVPAVKPAAEPEPAASKPAQVVLVAPSSVEPAKSTTPHPEWEKRIAILEQLKGQLTFGKAIAALLNLSEREDIDRLAGLERNVMRAPWSNSHALGVDATGRLGWAGVERLDPQSASGFALEHCGATNDRRCVEIVRNGEFKEKEFMQLARSLTTFDFSVARQSYIDALRVPARETAVRTPAMQSNNGKVYTSATPLVHLSVSLQAKPEQAPSGLSADANIIWNQRLALLNQAKGKLTFAKSFAILLDISNADDLDQLLQFEKRLEQSAWSHAYAIGLDPKGGPVWAYGARFGTVQFARSEVLEFCRKLAAGSCKTIVSNREFRENEFFELAEHFRNEDPETLRRTFLAKLRSAPRETEVPNGSGRAGIAFNTTRIYATQP